MPFTFSHPAAILPLNYLDKKRFSITGLVIGSMTPDFEYFIRFAHASVYSHTWLGLFWFDLPLGLLLAFIYHTIVRSSFIDNTPRFLKRRISRYNTFNWNAWFKKHWLVVLLSILTGAISHLVWDKLTHKTVRVITSIPAVKDHINTSIEHEITYFIFWDLSSVIGVIMVAYTIWQLPVDKKNNVYNNSTRYWLILLSIAIVVIGIRSFVAVYYNLGDVVIAVIDALLIGAIVTPFIYKRERLKDR